MFPKSIIGAAALGLTILLGAPTPAPAEELLAIENASVKEQTVQRLTRADLEALPQHVVVTTSDWTEGAVAFRGPLGRDVLALAGPASGSVKVVAANDYAVEIPVEDFYAFDVVFALEMDGRPLSLRDKGPIWIIYPRDDHAELQDPAFNARWVWQLERIIIQ